MNACTSIAVPLKEDHYELQFKSLVDAAKMLAFPCDPNGRVDMDHLNDSGRATYLFARAVVGGVFSRPEVHSRTP